MLVPNRFSNLKFSLLNVTALVVDYLLQEEKATLNDIKHHLSYFSKDFDREDVQNAVTFLYAIGRVEYSEKNDKVRIINHIPQLEVANA